MKIIAHLSDVHFGRVDYATVKPLTEAITKVSPDIVVLSGDLTQRARESQFEEAKKFLDALPKPQIVVPGNHDVPLYNVFARFLAPLDNYRKIISEDVEQFYSDDEMAIVGVNTARSATFKNGRINEEQVERVRGLMCDLGPTVTKIVVTHHPFDLPRQFAEGDLVGRARMAIESLAPCGVDVFLAGHYHFGHTGDTDTRYDIDGYNGLIIHAGTATSTRGRGEPNSFNIIRIDHPGLIVERYTWRPDEALFDLFSSEHFSKSADGWMRLADETPVGRKEIPAEPPREEV
ncbi:MAG: metallophosphoesterase [bacterium]|nr:metallophosphoesterase [Candidatus Kapabacteria bacterium]